MTKREDVYTRITQTVLEQLEAGVRPWHKPWDSGHAIGRIQRPLRYNGDPYSGINTIMLWLEAEMQGFPYATWMTLRQANELGGKVIRGSKSTPVVFARRIEKTETTDAGDEVDASYLCYKEYRVFNVDQLEGIPCHYYDPVSTPVDPIDRDIRAKAFFDSLGADIRTGGNRAYYSISTDHVQMPQLQLFEDTVAYEATLGHELTHWTRHKSRLDRSFGRKRWGDEGYAAEELVAEMGAAFLCADLDLTPSVREDHVSYIDNWIQVLNRDKRAIFTAASHAERAVRYLHDLQPAAAGDVRAAA